ncbi:MAG: fatty acid desaturase [Rhodobacterales bacterium]|nr:fatty acid desaturase [Rhodobacterales bacterium]
MRLTATSDRASLMHLAGRFALILLCVGLIAIHMPFWGLLLPVPGVLIVVLFTLEYECTHRTLFRQGWINEVVGRICGFLLVLPFGWFLAFHLLHHRLTNQPGLFPEPDGPTPETYRDWVWLVSGLPYWISEARLLIDLARRRMPSTQS